MLRSSQLRRLVPLGAALLLTGCALVWEGPDGRRHVLGYHATPAPAPAGEAVVRGLDLVGAALVLGQDRSALVLGAFSERQVALAGDTAVRLRCLECDLETAEAVRLTAATGHPEDPR